MTNKECTSCLLIKELSDFYTVRKRGKKYIKPICKNCEREKALLFKRSERGRITTIYNSQTTRSKKRGHDVQPYTKDELSDFMYKNGYKKLHKEWVDSGYDKNKSPSIDRIDDLNGYTLDNIQLLTWEENNHKAHEDRRRGIQSQGESYCQKVDQYDIHGNFIKEHLSVQLAAKAIGCSGGLVQIAISEKYKTAKCYIFKRHGENLTKKEAEKYYKNITGIHKFVIRESNDGEKLVFNNVLAAAKATGIKNIKTIQTGISRGCKVSGFKFYYGGVNYAS